MAISVDSYSGVLPGHQQVRNCCKAATHCLSVTDGEDALRREFEGVGASLKKCKADQCEAVQAEYTEHVLDSLQAGAGDGMIKSASSLLNIIFWRCLTDSK